MATPKDYPDILNELRKNHRKGKIQSYDARLKQLQAIYQLVKENEQEILGALNKDLRKNVVEGKIMETSQVLIDCGNAIQQLKDWMKPASVKPDLFNFGHTCRIYPEPYGVTLIMGAWNYPVQLVFLPLIGAIAAGNCAIVKPSELSPYTADCLTKLIEKYMDGDVVRVINGGIPESTELLKERFDLIFYTGSTFVGKIIMKAAAQHLTPVVLELGGKCPAFVDSTCDFDTVAQRIAWGKFSNCGQTCLAVDYVLCLDDCQEKLAEAMKRAINKFYGADPQTSDSLGRIVNNRHFQRLVKLIDESKVYYGNKKDEKELYISPTIMTNVTGEDEVMKDEIFGPLLPLLPMSSLDEAIEFVVDREKPLGLYVFSNKKSTVEAVLNNTSSGGVTVNDAIMHGGVPNLPFGGVGNSGIGMYHGKASFDVFSHKKSCLWKDQRLEGVNGIRYPPYDPNYRPLNVLLNLLMPKGDPPSSFRFLWLALLGVVFGFVYQFVILPRM